MKRQCNIVVGVRGIDKEAPGAPEDEEQKQDSDGASYQVEVKKDLDLDHQISQIHVVATCVVAAFTQKKMAPSICSTHLVEKCTSYPSLTAGMASSSFVHRKVCNALTAQVKH